ncbi:hypothetical protein AB3M80_26475 [Arthrospira platensis BEA 1257B]
MSESDRADLQPRKQSPPTMEEWLAIILAIATMGFVFFWVFGKIEPKSSFSLLSAKPETISDHRSLINVSDIVRQASSSTTSIISSSYTPESKSGPSDTVSSESTGLTLSWLNLEGLQIASPTTESTPDSSPYFHHPQQKPKQPRPQTQRRRLHHPLKLLLPPKPQRFPVPL